MSLTSENDDRKLTKVEKCIALNVTKHIVKRPQTSKIRQPRNRKNVTEDDGLLVDEFTLPSKKQVNLKSEGQFLPVHFHLKETEKKKELRVRALAKKKSELGIT